VGEIKKWGRIRRERLGEGKRVATLRKSITGKSRRGEGVMVFSAVKLKLW